MVILDEAAKLFYYHAGDCARDGGKLKILQLVCIAAAIALAAICQTIIGRTLRTAAPNTVAETEVRAELPGSLIIPAMSTAPSDGERLQSGEMRTAIDTMDNKLAALEQDYFSTESYSYSYDPTPAKPDLWYLVYYVYAEIPPDKKPADVVLESMKDIPVGTPLEEIKRASDVFGLDYNFMKTVAKIESDFDPKQRTGSYIGLFQLSKYEFDKYGSGDITNPRDNAIAAAYKFVTEAALFEWETHKKPTFSFRYLIHQQGWQGAAEHVGHPEQIAWKSMCATDEGREKGEKWCKRAVWQNTLPAIKHIWKSVDKLTSGAFVDMWRQRVDHLYSRYSEALAEGTRH